MAAEIHGEPFSSHHADSTQGSGFMADLKSHKIEVIIGGATLLVTLYFVTRGKSAAPATNTRSTGNLSTTGSTSVSTDMLANAMQKLSDQEKTDFQSVQQQQTAFGQTIQSTLDKVTAQQNAFGQTISSSLMTEKQQLQQQQNDAVQTLTGDILSVQAKQQSQYQSLQQQLSALGNNINHAGTGSASGNASGIQGYPTGSTHPGNTGAGSGSGSGSIVQTNGQSISNALQARNQIGDTAIVSFFDAFNLPSWIGLQYVAENFRLPWKAQSNPTQTQQNAFNTWLDNHGYRNASTNMFTPIVSSGTVPANVQAQLNAAYGG